MPLIVHATKQILDQWGEDGWELVQVVPGPDGQGSSPTSSGPGDRRTPRGRSGAPAGRAGARPCPQVAAPVAAYVPAVRRRRPGLDVRPAALRGRRAPGHRQGRASARGWCRPRTPPTWPGSARSTRSPPSGPCSATSTGSPGSSRWSASWPATRRSPASPRVVNGASQLLGEVFGDAGVHARSAVGVAVLPLDSPVEIEWSRPSADGCRLRPSRARSADGLLRVAEADARPRHTGRTVQFRQSAHGQQLGGQGVADDAGRQVGGVTGGSRIVHPAGRLLEDLEQGLDQRAPPSARRAGRRTTTAPAAASPAGAGPSSPWPGRARPASGRPSAGPARSR